MNLLATMQLEFQGQADFPWWALVDAVAAVALILYAGLLKREAATDLARPAMAGPLAALQAPPLPRPGGYPLWLVALLAGLLALAGTGTLVGIPALRRQDTTALLWTALVTAAAVALLYLRVYRYLSRFRMATLTALRVASLALLALLLFGPVLAFVSAPEKKSKLAVVVDASGSMSVADRENEPNRYRQSVLSVRDTLIPKLAEHYELQFFAYDGKHASPLGNADEFDRVAPNGETSDFVAALGLGASGGAKQVIFYSDGIHNGPVAAAAGLRSSVPVHPVLVGSPEIEPSTVPDIAVVSVDGPQTVTVNTEVKLTARVKSTAMSARTVRVMLMQGPGMLTEQRLVLHSGPTPQTVEFKYTPEKVGRSVVRVQVPVAPDERNEANNACDFPMLVTDPKLPVLYVEGRVRPEVGKLMRSLATDPNVSAVSLVQVRAGEFTISGVKPGDDLKGLPTNLQQWRRFRVIILGDLDASFLSDRQQRDLEEAVKEGTGLLMIGGQHSFAPGGWGATSLAGVLPVDLSKTDPSQVNTPFVPQLTAAGAASPILRNIAEFFIPAGGGAAGKQLPPLLGCVAIAGAKAGAEVLMVHPSEKINGKPALVLAVGHYGKGRTGAFAADTTSQWNVFLLAQGKDSPYNRFWGQMVRWMAGQEDMVKKAGPSVTSMLPKERYEAGEPVLLRAAVTDKEGQATAYAQVWAEITGPDAKSARVTMSRVEDQVGVYEGKYAPQMAGNFKVKFAASKDKVDLGSDATSFSVAQAAGEMEILAANPKTMDEIARTTQGRAPVGLTGVAALADALNADLPPTAQATKTTYGLWTLRASLGPAEVTLGHLAGVAFFATLGLEWYLRRKWQLQ